MLAMTNSNWPPCKDLIDASCTTYMLVASLVVLALAPTSRKGDFEKRYQGPGRLSKAAVGGEAIQGGAVQQNANCVRCFALTNFAHDYQYKPAKEYLVTISPSVY